VNEDVPSVTILIAARPDEVNVKAVPPCRALNYPAGKIEILLARGKQPSAQRNAGMKTARGELVYFLDDDSLAQVENLQRGTSHFQDPKVEMVGGPNVCPPGAPWLEKVFARVLGSRLAFGPSRARYIPVGRVRETSEKELILCNLLARRDALLALGGFNEALYPNEENALMDELQKRGGKLIYDPDFFVYRRPRSTLKAFCKMLMTYGRGRAEQFRLHPTFGSVLNFVPPLFLLYLVVFVVVLFVAPPWITDMMLAPLVFYVVLVLAEAAVLGVFHRLPRGPKDRGSELDGESGKHFVIGAATAPLIALTHVLYGFGFWRGLFTKLDRAHDKGPTPVIIERVEPEAEC
jgi:GT2 family glycosyltransferase